MIQNGDITERLNGLIGKELTDEHLHEALFCEKKHKKLLVRFQLGKQSYVKFRTRFLDHLEMTPHAEIHVLGNPNKFSVKVERKNDKVFIISEARVNYNYLL
ncbi:MULTISPECIES: hypothetical protein [Bacillus]|uniref:hypothetical protein n=1 Tax=Bacillus TaxID=1386 RepID=UPI000BB766B0|nr:MULTISPECIES: hypothetical protein [Bacillus]